MTRGDEYQRALERALGRLTVAPDATLDDVTGLIADAEREARREVAARWIGEARTRAEEHDRRRAQRERVDAQRERAERELRKKLGDEVDPDGRYWLLTHPVGAVAFPRDPAEEDFGVGWQPPAITGVRAGRRYAQGIELAKVDGVAMVADHGAARSLLLDRAAAERAKQPVGAIEED